MIKVVLVFQDLVSLVVAYGLVKDRSSGLLPVELSEGFGN